MQVELVECMTRDQIKRGRTHSLANRVGGADHDAHLGLAVPAIDLREPNVTDVSAVTALDCQEQRVGATGKRRKPAFVLIGIDAARSIGQERERGIVRPLEGAWQVVAPKRTEAHADRLVGHSICETAGGWYTFTSTPRSLRITSCTWSPERFRTFSQPWFQSRTP